MTWSKKHKKIIKNDKDSVENENNRKKKNCDYDTKFLREFLNGDNFKNLTTKPPCENIKIIFVDQFLMSINEVFG